MAGPAGGSFFRDDGQSIGDKNGSHEYLSGGEQVLFVIAV
jgi:hypothetical protein